MKTGIINSDATWTRIGSPYTLTGPVAVNQGVTLTIEAGTTVNLNNYYIQVNGTLIAIGNNVDQIKINGPADVRGGIIFTSVSNGWNQQTGSGCIIENSIISTSVIAQNSVKVDHNTITGSVSGHGSSVISDNNITGGTVSIFDSTVLSNNIITQAGGIGSMLFGGTVLVSVGTNSFPVISNNVIKGSHDNGGHGNEGIQVVGNTSIAGNTIDGCKIGIQVESTGNAIINKNLFTNNQDGIDILGTSNIQENLLTTNTNAIYVSSNDATISSNNIYENNYNLVLGFHYDIDATNNWWGTTDQQAINQTIHDNKNDFNLGTVNFVPFLTAPNPQAPSINAAVTPTPSPTQSQTSNPSSTPTVPELPAIAIFPLFVAMLFVVVWHRGRKTALPP